MISFVAFLPHMQVRGLAGQFLRAILARVRVTGDGVIVCQIYFQKGQDNRTNIPKRDTDGSDQSSNSTFRSELTQHPQTVTHTNLPDPPQHKHSRAKERGGLCSRRGRVRGVP